MMSWGEWHVLLSLSTLVRTVLFCTVLYCTVLYCTVLYCTVPCRVYVLVILVHWWLHLTFSINSTFFYDFVFYSCQVVNYDYIYWHQILLFTYMFKYIHRVDGWYWKFVMCCRYSGKKVRKNIRLFHYQVRVIR